jgi:DNA-binding transcriptional regulator YhcF (GntR family)
VQVRVAAERLQCGEEVELPMTRRDIADYLGLTFETVSRTLSQLEQRSVIARLDCNRIALSNRTVLKQVSDGYCARPSGAEDERCAIRPAAMDTEPRV